MTETMDRLRERATDAVAKSMLQARVAMKPHEVEKAWDTLTDDMRAIWRERAKPAVDEMLGILFFEIQGGIEKAAVAMWRASPAGFAAQEGEYLKMPAVARDTYRKQVLVALSMWIPEAILNRIIKWEEVYHGNA